jgi:hypothetical protein
MNVTKCFFVISGILLLSSVFSATSLRAEVASGEKFWSSGTSGAGDYAGAEAEAIEKADAQCQPGNAVQVSDWVEGNLGKYVYMRAGAYFVCTP